MNEDVLNMSVGKFLKKVGVTSQREIYAPACGACHSHQNPKAMELHKFCKGSRSRDSCRVRLRALL